MPTAPGLVSVSWPALAEIVGKEHLRPATTDDAIDGVQPQMIAEPGTPEELAHALQWVRTTGLKVAPRGGGTKLAWGNPPSTCDLVLSTKRLNRVLEHAWADMTATVEAGCTVAALQKALAEHRQRLAIDPLWPDEATIGGILSTNDSGSLRVRYGSLRDLIIGITIALPDGTLAKSGGKVVKNVAGYDMMKLLTGALGTLGVIVQAIFRLHPLPKQSRSLTFMGTAESLNQLLRTIQASKLAFTGLQLRAEKGSAQLDIRFDGTAAGIEAQVQQVSQIAGNIPVSDASANAWSAHQSIWDGASLLAKVSVLPTHLAQLCAAVQRAGEAQSLAWKIVLQGVGNGYVRLDGPDANLRTALMELRAAIGKISGWLAVLGAPLAVKRGLDVWGPTSDAHPIMVRIKQRFDPEGTLNPGRFIGGI